MAVENITLNLIPTGETPSIHVAQFDVERPFTVTLKEGTDDFTPTGYDIELQVRKVDNNIVTAIPTSTSGNVVTFNTSEQMTACSGTNLAELQLTKDSQTFATLHFYLVVQRDVLAGGITSESDIYNLTEQIAAIVPEVIGDDYYNKEEVDEKIAEIPTFDPTNYYDKSETDALLDDKANVSDLPDMSNYYDKSETDALLDDKANVSDLPDMSNYYDKSETDALLDDKADVSDLPDMSNYYNKTEVDNKITGLYEIKTASGSLVHITDGGNDIPVKLLKSEIVALETGTGPKSPTNPYTISGYSSGVVSVCGKNLFDGQSLIDKGATYSGDEYTIPLHTSVGKLNINIPQYAQLYVSYQAKYSTNMADFYIGIAYKDGTVSRSVSSGVANTFKTYSFISNPDKEIDGVYLFAYDSDRQSVFKDIQIKLGETATPCEAYNGTTYTFAFGQTVYGGHFDNKGNLVVTHRLLEFDYTSAWAFENSSAGKNFYVACDADIKTSQTSENMICNVSPVNNVATVKKDHCIISAARNFNFTWGDTLNLESANDFKTYLQTNNIVIKAIAELTTPITLAISSQDIPTLSGENNIFSNCGDVEVQYFTDKSDGISELIKAFM